MLLVSVMCTLIALAKEGNGMPPAVASVLIEEGVKLVAPFAESAVKRILSSVFGDGGPARSTDVIIFNKSNRTFRLAENHCNRGGFSSDMFPEPHLAARSSTVYRVESHGVATGCQCACTYESPDTSRFYLFTENPYVGSNDARENHSPNIQILITNGGGNNNQVRFIVEDIPGTSAQALGTGSGRVISHHRQFPDREGPRKPIMPNRD